MQPTPTTPPDVTVVFPGAIADEISISMSPLLMQQWKQIAVAAALVEANATIKTLQDSHAINAQSHRNSLAKIDELTEQIKQRDALIANLKMQLVEALKEPPVVTLPKPFEPVPPIIVPPSPPVVPVTPKDKVFPFVGAYFEDPRPSDSVDDQAQAKEHADAIIPSMVFAAENNPAMDDFIAFCNPEDVKWKALPRTMFDLKKRWWQSPIQAFYIPGAQTQTVLVDHLKKLHAAGMYGAIIDDAHNLTAPDMEHLIDLIQLHCPGAPVMASFGADFDDIKEGYPNERYFDMRQWFLRTQEKESVYFQKWETAHDAQLYAADVYRRGNGFQHTPDRIRSMFATALPFVDGIAWYSLLNKETNIIADHKAMIAKIPNAVTVWSTIVQCSNEYAKTYAARIVKA